MEVHSPQSESLLSEPTLQGDTSNVGHRGTLSVWINRLVRRILSSPGLDLFWQAGHESSGGVGLGLCVGLRGKSARERRLSMAQVHLRGFVANSALPAFRQVVGRARVRCTAAICPRLSRLALQNHSANISAAKLPLPFVSSGNLVFPFNLVRGRTVRRNFTFVGSLAFDTP